MTFGKGGAFSRSGDIRVALLALIAGISCGHLTDPRLPGDAEQFVPPPVYAQWWAMVEECSGLQGSLENVQWFAVPEQLWNPANTTEPVAGYWSLASNRIVLNSNDTVNGGVVRHEMLHALLRGQGHPRSAFLQKCGGVVSCPSLCVKDAGAPPSPDPATPRVTPADIEITSAVSVVSPSSATQPSFGTFTIFAHNPFAYPIVVVLPARSGGGTPTTYQYGIIRTVSGGGVGSGDLAYDIGVTYFAAGETKRDVFDFAIIVGDAPSLGVVPGLGPVGIALPPETYLFSGDYGGHSATDIRIILNQ